ncbi:hypothetical protein MMC13_008331 [Lambiella insularis]|nr:hypothetical protein [Lambiella insularis]
MLEAEFRGLSLRCGPSPPQSHSLLDTFGPQAAVALLKYTTGLQYLYLYVHSHLSCLESTRDVRRLPNEEELTEPRRSQDLRPQEEEANGIATRPFRPDVNEPDVRKLKSEAARLQFHLSDIAPNESRYMGYDTQRLRAVCESVISIRANESVNSSTAATKYPIAKWVHRFPDGLVVGQNSGDIMVGHIYDSLETSAGSVVPSQGQDNQTQNDISHGAIDADSDFSSPKAAIEDSDEPPRTPDQPRHTTHGGQAMLRLQGHSQGRALQIV